MKKTKPKAKPTGIPTVNKSAEKADDLKSPWKEMGGLPTTEQLTQIAATLSRNINDAPDALAEKAMKLWLASRKRIFLAEFGDEVGLQNSQWVWDKSRSFSEFYEDPFLPTGDYPITRDQFLQTMLPKLKHRTFDLAKIAKAFVRDTLHKRNGKEPTQDEVSGAYGRWRPYENVDQANATAFKFKRWYEMYVRHLRSIAGQKSAKKRADKKAEREK
jgi:hypothetical protein